jgi:nucleoside-diphosphate-sugar epimerase
MIGRKLVDRLARDGALGGEQIARLSLVDVVEPSAPAAAGFLLETLAGDLAEPSVAWDLVSTRPDVVFHLAAVVSGEAESDFEKGYRVNVDGSRLLFDAIRAAGPEYVPRIVFSSSIAVFGPPFPEVIADDQRTTPLTSYGTEKAIVELLLSDYSRRGFLDGVAVRLPTICVRPGEPNLAASGFFSSIVREPLNGESAVLPVPETVRHWFASPRAAVGFLLRAATLDAAALGLDRCLTMPGVSETVGGQIAALRRIAGEDVVGRIRREPDETVERTVESWPRRFDARRALAFGFRAEADFEEIIRVYIEDELGGSAGAPWS